MMHLNLISKLNIKNNDKCEICVEAKLLRISKLLIKILKL